MCHLGDHLARGGRPTRSTWSCAAAAARTGSVRLVEWAADAQEHPDWLAGDGCTATRPATRARPAIAKAPRRARPPEPDCALSRTVPLPTGADARLRNEAAPLAVVLLNGGLARRCPVRGARPASCWRRARAAVSGARLRRGALSDQVVECARLVHGGRRAALDLAGRPSLLVGFSMGGAVSIGVAGHPAVTAVLGLAPWIPERLSLDGLRDKRFDVLHGSWDRYLPGIPGVSAASSRRGFERAQALGIEARTPSSRVAFTAPRCGAARAQLQRLPRAGAWVAGVGQRLARFQAENGRRLRRAGAASAESRSAAARSRRGRASRASGS